jgi:SAM-dependent methyltransferase
MTTALERVRDYYEQHTGTFVALGQGGALGSMHRAVFAPGVTTRSGAFHYVEDCILMAVRGSVPRDRPLRVVDLGCGVGGSLGYLATRTSLHGIGVTLSATQATLARERLRAAGLQDRIEILEGDYTTVPEAPAAADLVFAIESFVHAPDPGRFFRQARRLLQSGGTLVICDDFRRPSTPPRAEASIARFRRGWRVHALLTPAELRAVAVEAGFSQVSTQDLTPYLDLGRARDRAIDVMTALVERLPWRWTRLDPWVGGSALQECLRHGWLGYELVVFRATGA